MMYLEKKFFLLNDISKECVFFIFMKKNFFFQILGKLGHDAIWSHYEEWVVNITNFKLF